MADKEKVQKEVRKIQMTPEIAKNLINMSRQNLNSVMNRKAHVEQSLIGLDATMANIGGLEENKDENGMINLGNGVYVSLKFPEKVSKALFLIGNEIMVEKPLADIKTILEERRAKLQKEYEILVKQEAELSDNLNKLYFYMSNMTRKPKLETKE
jgi:prefoldin subunit 5